MLEPVFLAHCLQNKLIPGAFCAKGSLIIFIRALKVSFSANNEWVADPKMRLLRQLNIYQGDEFFNGFLFHSMYLTTCRCLSTSWHLPIKSRSYDLWPQVGPVTENREKTAFLLSIHPPSFHPDINHCHSIDFSGFAPINTNWQPSPIFSKTLFPRLMGLIQTFCLPGSFATGNF